jgi:uncharacterized iron-regulated membrane protein
LPTHARGLARGGLFDECNGDAVTREAKPQAAQASDRVYARLWRWHFFAAFIVIPFVLWQSTTGTLYLWSERLMDALHPQLRFVQAGGQAMPPSAQVRAALASRVLESPQAATLELDDLRGNAHHDFAAPVDATGVQRVVLPEDANRSTAVLLVGANGLPFPVFVDPYTARVLGSLTAPAWIPGLTRALHGGWPLGDPGSWLLELGDGWAIVMIATGLYLWWPRGRGFLAGLWPRVRSGPRVLIRDLHSCVAVWFSLVLLFFLVSALPWTAFWGGKLLPRIEAATDQTSPAGFSPGGASVTQMMNALPSVDEFVREARARNVRGTLDVRLAPWPDAPLFMTNIRIPPSQDRTVLGDASSGALLGDYTNADLPAIPRFVALGVHVHQGDFGPWNLWLNTAFALALIWLSVTGVISWWTRRPSHKLAPPPRVTARAPRFLVATAIAVCVVFPILGLSVVCVFLADLLLVRLMGSTTRLFTWRSQ